MERFLPCPACGRLILSTEHACPFCASAVAFATPSPLPSDVGIARAARAVLGAAVVATLAACGGTETDSVGTPPESATQKPSSAPSGTVSAKPSAAPSATPSAAPSASVSAAPSASSAPSAAPSTTPKPQPTPQPTPTMIMPPYGAPPPHPVPKS